MMNLNRIHSIHRRSCIALCWGLSATLLCIAGCSRAEGQKARYGVGGKVTLNGEPISTGSINFVPGPETKGPNSGTKITDGYYSIHKSVGLVPGQYTVEIRSQKPSGKKIYIGDVPLIQVESKYVEEMIEAVPAQYNRSSTLKVEIADNSNSGMDFDLVGEGEKPK